MAFDIVKNVFSVTSSHAEKPMTLQGTLTKVTLLIAAMIGAASLSWWQFFSGSSFSSTLTIGAFIGGLILSIVTIFRPHLSRYTALPYAVLQGCLLGGISATYELRYGGITTLALALTSATAVGMLLVYRLKLIEVTETVKAVIISATAGIGLTYLVLFGLALCGVQTTAFYQSSSMTSILFSLFVVGIAAFNLLLDFQLIEESVEAERPDYMEWYAAFMVLVTLIWLYVELLRLLAKVARRK